MRAFAFLLLALIPMRLHAGDKGDTELTRLMIGIWRSPRHTYVYAADGRWWNADGYDWLDKPEGAHGRWRIENHQLVEDVDNRSFGGFEDLSRRRIIKFTRDRVIFEGSSMKRWTRQDVKNWDRP
ncbi:MAG TPA: hypothetical protein VGM66_07355 [Candidatus Udaeobacter sp.]|jgi:hypothetical protein